jgi:hypothetical protein
MELSQVKREISRLTGFAIPDIVVMETEQNKVDEMPYYYLFVYRGIRYRLLFGKLAIDR